MQPIANGSVVVTRRFNDGKEFVLFEKKNLLVYGAADIIAGLLAGDIRFKPSHMYFLYQNSVAAPSGPTLDRSFSRAYMDTISHAGGDPQDWLRIPMLSSPLLQSSAAEYDHNTAIFSATSAAVAAVGRSPSANDYSAAANSKLFNVSLVAAPGGADDTQDVVFSSVNITPQSVLSGSHLTVYWSIRIN